MQFTSASWRWDYTGTFLSIDGRTNFVFMCMWGVLGCLWVKLLLPRMLKLVNMIPWNWRYSATPALSPRSSLTNGAMTLFALDSWYQREAGHEPTNAIERFCAEHYDNDFMEHRLPSMSINPDNATIFLRYPMRFLSRPTCLRPPATYRKDACALCSRPPDEIVRPHTKKPPTWRLFHASVKAGAPRPCTTGCQHWCPNWVHDQSRLFGRKTVTACHHIVPFAANSSQRLQSNKRALAFPCSEWQ